MLESASTLYCKPEVPFSSKKWILEGRTVLEIDVRPGDLKPYLARTTEDKWLAFTRVKDENMLVNAIQIRVWKNENRKRGIFLKYTEKEKFLLDYLERNELINLSGFSRQAGISYRKASDILVRLIGLKVVKIIYTEGKIFYGKTPETRIT